jgi:hypothetical protein
LLLVNLNQPLNAAKLIRTEAMAPFKPNRIDPEFGLVIVAFDMNVGWFIAISRVEKEPVRTTSKYGGHAVMVLRFQDHRNPQQSRIARKLP